jgi:Alginate export
MARWHRHASRMVAAGLLAGAVWFTGAGRADEPKKPAGPASKPELIPAPTLSAPAAPAVPPAGEVAPGAASACPACQPPAEEECPSIWKHVPPVRPMPRLGDFPIPPSGPGYYSFSDLLHDQYREKPPRLPYPAFALMPLPFFEADFRYLDDPNTQDPYYPLKRNHIGDNWMFSAGGEARWRYMNEDNSRLTQSDNVYSLVRTRVYSDLWYRDIFRVFVEGVWSDSLWHDLAPLPTDIDRGDFQNLFVDVKLPFGDDHPAYLRIGRQELLLGSQRLVGIPDWVNTRRTFQGARITRTGEQFDYDFFWVQPVIPNAERFDSVDNNQNFFGAWGTYRPKPGTFLDVYYLFLDNTNHLTQQSIVRAPYNVHTIGSRYAGDVDGGWLYDVEGALQFGERGSEDIFAGMATVGTGYHFADRRLNPTLWLYYDYASGDRNPNHGTFSTFNQLFPFGHYYLGWLDVVGRQNIHDLNLHMFLYPTPWITFWAQYHHFWLDQSRDALYNAAGVAFRRDPTGNAGHDVGSEMDLILNFHIGPHSDILTGYSKLWGGDFLEKTASKTRAVDSDMFYVQYTFRW